MSQSPLSNTTPDSNSTSEATERARRRFINVWTAVGVILLVGVGIYVANVLSMAIGIIVWTAVFVFVLMGPVAFFERHGVRRSIGAAISYVLLIAVIALLLFIIFSPNIGINAQFQELGRKLPDYVTAFTAWVSDTYADYSDFLQNDQIQEWLSDALDSLNKWVQSLASVSASAVVTAGASLANIVMCIGFALVIAFWMLVDLPKLGKEVERLINDNRKADAEMLGLTVTRVMGGYLKATIIQCTIIGVACGIMFALLGVPSAAALGTITGLLNIIPIIGPWIGGALAFVVCVITSPLTGVIALVGTVVIQQVVYTFVSPKLMGSSVDIHPALTFIALMAGSGVGAAMGGIVGSLVGALLAIPLVAMLKSIFVYYFEKRSGRRIVSEDGVFFRGAQATDGDELDPMADATSPMPPVSSTTGRIRGLTGKLPIIDLEEERPAHKK